MSKEREELARYLLQHCADDDPPQLTPEAQAWAEGEALKVLQAENHEYRAALTEIFVNVREIRNAAYGKSAEQNSVMFAIMADEILEVTRNVLKGYQR